MTWNYLAGVFLMGLHLAFLGVVLWQSRETARPH
jgi:hypothetical protein